MRIYVASAWAERIRACQVMYQLRAAGHTITYDWTQQEQETTAQALADYRGVVTADVLVFVAEKPYTSGGGAICEMGIALGAEIPVFLMGDGADRCIFTKHPNVYRGIHTLLKVIP